MASLLDHFRSLMGGSQALPVHPSHGITPAQRAYMATDHYNAQGQPTYETLGPQTPQPSAADWNAAPPAAANQHEVDLGRIPPHQQFAYRVQEPLQPRMPIGGTVTSPLQVLPRLPYAGRLTGPHLGLAGTNPVGLPTMNPQLTRSPVMPTANPQNSQINPMASSPVNPQRQVASPMRIVTGPVADQTRISLH